MRCRCLPAFVCVLALPGACATPRVGPASAKSAPAEIFIVKPYLQLGSASPSQRGRSGMPALLWHAADGDAAWAVETRPAAGGDWSRTPPPTYRRVAASGVRSHDVWSATLENLTPGEEFDYRVLRRDETVFTARARAPKASGQPYRFAVFGDCAAATRGQRAIAYQTFLARPDFVFLTGDIVYSNGRISEYRKNFFPVYNADAAAPDTGAPLLRSTLFVAAPGNHDINGRNLGRYPDGLAYFLYWSQPLNGPLVAPGTPNTPALSGLYTHRKTFLESAGAAYPRMANFSFDYAGAHWTVLDSNRYVDWTDPLLREWVARDLEAAKDAAWRFVAFHHPGFNSSRTHFNQQQMRLLSDIFERGNVDIVFTGHVHNYQRTFPLRFTPQRNKKGRWQSRDGRVEGRLRLDRSFDGQNKTRPDGILHIVTGAGGAGLYNPEQQKQPRTLQSFTARYRADTHSLTVVDVDGSSLRVRQIADSGQEIDRFTVTRQP